MATASTQSARTASAQTLRLSRETKAKLGFGAAAGLSFLFSVYLWFSGQHDEGLFVGIWVPSILSLGALALSPTRRVQ